MQLKDTRAIVTGGVSGLGFAVAKHLAAHGGKVALFDVNDEKGAPATPPSSRPMSATKPASAPTSPPPRNSSAA